MRLDLDHDETPELFRKAKEVAEKKSVNMLSIFKKTALMNSSEILESIKKLLDNTYVPNYIFKGIEFGRRKKDILSESFQVSQEGILNEVGSTVSKEERERRIEEVKKLEATILALPKPNMFYIPMTKQEANRALDMAMIGGETILYDQAITHNLETHYLMAVVMSLDELEPLISKIIKDDKYPEQLFTDEWENWLFDLRRMWVIDNLKTSAIMYFINMMTDEFWYEGFLRRWDKVGSGAFALEKRKHKILTVPVSDLQNEFFCQTIYRLNPGDYNSPITIPVVNTYTEDLFNSPALVSNFSQDTNTACLQFQLNQYNEQDQYYYRIFGTRGDRPKSNAYIFLKMCEQDLTEQMLLSNLFTIDLKLPGQTGWMSLNKKFRARGFNGADGEGILIGVNRLGPGIIETTFERFSISHSGHQAIMRIKYPASSPQTTAIERITFINWIANYQ